MKSTLPPLEGEFEPAGGQTGPNSGAALMAKSVDYQEQTSNLFAEFMEIQRDMLDEINRIGDMVGSITLLMFAASNKAKFATDDLKGLEEGVEKGRGRTKDLPVFKEQSTLEKLLKNMSAFLELTLFPLLIAFAAAFNSELVPWLAALAGLRVLMRTTGVTFADLGKSLVNIGRSFVETAKSFGKSISAAGDRLSKWATSTFKPAADSKLGKMLTKIADWFTRATARASVWFDDVAQTWQKTTKLFKSISGAFRTAGTFLVEIGGKVGKMIEPVVQWAKDLWSVLSKVFGSVGKAGSMLSKILGPLTRILPGLLRFVALPIAVLMTAYDVITGFMDGFEKDGIAGGIMGAIDKLLAGTVGVIVDVLTEIASWIASALGFENLAEYLDEIKWTDIWTTIKTTIEDLLFGIIKSMADGLEAGWEMLKDKIGMGGMDSDDKAPSSPVPPPPVAPIPHRAGSALANSNEETATMKAEKEAAAQQAIVNTQVATNQTNVQNSTTVMADATFTATPPEFAAMGWSKGPRKVGAAPI